MPNEFQPDFSRIGQTVYTRGDEATVSGSSVFLHGGEFFPVRMEEGERYGETLLIPARAVRTDTQAAPIVTTCSETIDGDPSTAIRLSFQVRVF